MAKKKQVPKEILKKDMPTKKVYHYVDSENDIDIKCKEIFKKTSKIIHYPFRTRNGRPKYDSINKIIYEDMPEPLPRGFLKKFTTGYGFKKELNPLLFYLTDKLPQVSTITVSTRNKSQFIGNKQVVFNLKDLDIAYPQISLMFQTHRDERDSLANNILSKIFPGRFIAEIPKYNKGQLNAFISQHSLNADKLSGDDVKSISGLFSKLPSTHEFIKKRGILSTKESVDRIFIEDILERFNELYNLKTDSKNLEGKWQEFFRDNILYFNFGYIDSFEKNRIQGDVSTDIPDFIILNTYGYLDVFEIKTHLTQLLSFDTGRKNFYWSSEGSKTISQAENYIDSITKEELKISKNILEEYGHNVNAIRPTVYIIASSKENLAGKNTKKYKGVQKRKLNNDFRRLNNALKNITFVLYDELLDVFQNTLKRLKLSEQDNDS